MSKKTRRTVLLSYDVIAAAVNGDPDAMNSLLKHYSGYIDSLATRESFGSHGFRYTQIDDDLRKRLETKLIIATMRFDLTY